MSKELILSNSKEFTMQLIDTTASFKEYDFLTFIARIQPLHTGHCAVIDTARAKARKVIVLIGSSFQSRDLRNPWSFKEREEMLRAEYPDSEDWLIIAPLIDDLYNETGWIERVQQTVNGIVHQYPFQVNSAKPKIGLIGHSKDHTSYYLSMFPQWGSVNVANVKNISATPIREDYFFEGTIGGDIPASIFAYLAKFKKSPTYQLIADEANAIREYKKIWSNSPYPPVFVTTDAVVIQSGHVLLIKRRAYPGKGLLALPGGFINQYEPIKQSMLRELREETKIKVPTPVLMGSISKQMVFDDPYRSSRGRTITHAFLIELVPSKMGLPKVKGSDDAEKAKWYPLADLNPEMLFEDHYQIIKAMIG